MHHASCIKANENKYNIFIYYWKSHWILECFIISIIQWMNEFRSSRANSEQQIKIIIWKNFIGICFDSKHKHPWHMHASRLACPINCEVITSMWIRNSFEAPIGWAFNFRILFTMQLYWKKSMQIKAFWSLSSKIQIGDEFEIYHERGQIWSKIFHNIFYVVMASFAMARAHNNNIMDKLWW